MLAVITANLTCSELFKQQSVFVMLMRHRGLDPFHDPFIKALQSKPVLSVTERDIQLCEPVTTQHQAERLIEKQAKYIVVASNQNRRSMFPLVDLVTWLSDHKSADSDAVIDLNEIPAQHTDLGEIEDNASVFDALEKMNESDLDALLVKARFQGATGNYGVVTRDAINHSYRFDKPGA
jgi:hypothetical protein